jgi:hypothetical protein
MAERAGRGAAFEQRAAKATALPAVEHGKLFDHGGAAPNLHQREADDVAAR